ncbi:hypothetical protein QFZ35_003194 [Arthrobacter ulcerisalmonis]|nr:hypothetical protein [Arthrobacter ulcerisalmonis]MDQ0664696.1 hypothetical protein [Arthrobacter ulcerisalmonis]
MTTVTLEIPDAILKGIDSGELFRWGGVIRDAAGHIVTHLADAPAPKASGLQNVRVAPGLLEKVVERSVAVMKTGASKETIVIASAMVVTAAVAGGAVVAIRNIQASKAPVPERLSAYNRSLAAYLHAVRDGGLEPDTVGRLIADFDDLAANVEANGRRVKLDFSTKRGKLLAGVVFAYTRKLADAHGLDMDLLLDCEKAQGQSSGNESVDELRRHLVVQRRILREAE